MQELNEVGIGDWGLVGVRDWKYCVNVLCYGRLSWVGLGWVGLG